MAPKPLFITPTRNTCGFSRTDVGVAKVDLQQRALVNCITETVSSAVSKKVALAAAVSVVDGQY